MDPWPGEGFKIVKYSYLLSNSRSSWMGVDILKTPPVAAKEIPIPHLKNGASERVRVDYRNGSVNITFYLQRTSPVDVSIHSLQGVRLWSFYNNSALKGQYTNTYFLTTLPPGNYLLSIDTENNSVTTLITHTFR